MMRGGERRYGNATRLRWFQSRRREGSVREEGPKVMRRVENTEATRNGLIDVTREVLN